MSDHVSSHPDRPNRRSIRLPDCDYAWVGGYGVTIVTSHRRCIFGQIQDGEIQLSPFGRVALECWQAIPTHAKGSQIDAFVVMPNHVHGIVLIVEPVEEETDNALRATHASPLHPTGNAEARMRGPAHRSLGSIIGSYKSAVSKQINRLGESPGTPVWQRNYYERVLRNEQELNHARHYIFENPLHWDRDPENPAVSS